MGCGPTLSCRILSPRKARLEAQSRINVQHRSVLDIFSYEERGRSQNPVVHEWFPLSVDWSVKHPVKQSLGKQLEQQIHSFFMEIPSSSLPVSMLLRWKPEQPSQGQLCAVRVTARLLISWINSVCLWRWIVIFCVILLNVDIVHWHCTAMKRSQKSWN